MRPSAAASIGTAAAQKTALSVYTALENDQSFTPEAAEILEIPEGTSKHALFKAYFTDGVHIGDVNALADCATDVGFDRNDVVAFLESDGGLAEVTAELIEARDEGITAVPTYIFNGTWQVPGAQEPETFAQVLRKMAEKATADA